MSQCREAQSWMGTSVQMVSDDEDAWASSDERGKQDGAVIGCVPAGLSWGVVGSNTLSVPVS